jgi:DNA modification methylase
MHTETPTQRRRISIAYRPIDELRTDPNNPRVHSPKQLAQIARSIETFGFNVPVLIDAEDRVVAGHGRILASRRLGLHQVPVIRLEHLSEEQARAFLIADNRLAENATWDEQLLAEQLRALSLAEIDFDIEVTGFEMGEIDLRIQGLGDDPGAGPDPDDDLPADSGPPVTRVGDLWVAGRHRILCGNALEAASFGRLMDAKPAAMVFTDPPYNVRIRGNVSGLGRVKHAEFAMASGEMSEAEYTAFLAGVFRLMASHSVAGSIHFACADWRHLGEYLMAGKAAYRELKNLCVWAKDNAGMGSLYRSQYELVFVFKHGKATHRNNIRLGRFGRGRSNLWQYRGANSFGRSSDEGNLLALHPTVKPVRMVADAILDCSGRGEIVLDPFLGSGTTLIAAERTGRHCYAMELEPKYVDAAVRRWQAHTGDECRHAVSGKHFDAPAGQRARKKGAHHG